MDKFYWQAYWGRGFSSAKQGQFANGVNEFSRFLAYRDSYGAYGDMKPYDLNYEEQAQQAAEAFTSLLKTHKKWYLYSGRAVSYMKLKDLEKAKLDLDEALKGDPPQEHDVLIASLYGMRGNCNLALGQTDAAIADYSKGLKARTLVPLFRARSLAYKKAGNSILSAKDDENVKGGNSEQDAQAAVLGVMLRGAGKAGK